MQIMNMRLGLAAGLLTAAFASTQQAHAAAPASVAVENGTLKVDAGNGADDIALRLAPGAPQTLQVDADGTVFSIPRETVARIKVDGGNGNDVVRFDEANGVVNATTPTVIDGGRGDDTLLGGSGAETLIGDRGDDVVDGNRGADTGILGSGDDEFVWDNGDGSDVVEGGRGQDTMTFNGALGAEQFDVSASGGRVRFFRTQGTITMDLNGVESVTANTFGGADTLTANDLSGTDLSTLDVDLALTPGGTTPDGVADRVIVNGTAGDDAIVASGSNGSATVTGLAATVNVSHAGVPEGDVLAINGLAGNDTIDSSGLAAGTIGFDSQP
jgi:hypothetical protein